MQVDTGKRIHGLTPGDLKQLLKKERFSTPDAMVFLDLDEPEASAVLAELARTGWIGFAGTSGYVDQWEVAQRGRRLLATRILKRIQRARGLEILDQVLAVARSANADQNRSWRVTRIALFGSLLDEGRTDVGDVDLVVEIDRRRLAKKELQAITQREEDEAPARYRNGPFNVWPEVSLKKALQVCPHVSLHPASDLTATGAAHRELYAFDIETEQEKPVPAEIVPARPPSMSEELSEFHPLTESKAISSPVPWPPAEEKPPEIKVSREDAVWFQHLWANGASVEEIVAARHRSLDAVRTYLGWMSAGRIRPALPPFDMNVQKMLMQTLAAAYDNDGDRPAMNAEFRVRDGSPSISIDLRTGERRARAWRMGSFRAMSANDNQLRRCGEAVLETAALWLDKVRPNLKDLIFEATVFCPSGPVGGARETSSAVRVPRFRDLAAPLQDAVRATIAAAPSGRNRTAELRVACGLLGDEIEVSAKRRDGARWNRASLPSTARQNLATAAKAVVGTDHAWSDGFSSFELFVED